MGQLCFVLHCLSNHVLIHAALVLRRLNAIILQCCIVICLLIVSAHLALAVPVKFSASVYHVCTVRGRPSSVALTLESLKEHNFDFTVNVITRDGTAKSI